MSRELERGARSGADEDAHRLEARMREAAPLIVPAWTKDRSQRVRERISSRLEGNEGTRRSRPRRVFLAGAMSVGLALIVSAVAGPPALEALLQGEVAERVSLRAGREETVVTLSDGSIARVPEHGTSELRVVESGPGRIVVELRGSARFEVKKDPSRVFRVLWDVFEIEVIGTRFSLETSGDQSSLVRVEEGSVRVSSKSAEITLSGGQSLLLPRGARCLGSPSPCEHVEPSGHALPVALGEPADRLPRPRRSHRRTHRRNEPPRTEHDGWQRLARAGDYEAAYAAYAQEAAPLKSSADRLLLADVARFAGHPAEAVAPLQAILTERSDPLRALAAFTLGRLCLDELGRPADAALAFRQVRELSPEGPLVEDAMAREVEALSRMGRREEARSLAAEFLGSYPDGIRRDSVRRFGGLEPR